MLMNRLSPLHLLEEMQNTFNRFDEVAGGNRPRLAERYPAICGWSDDKSNYVEVELPGMALEDLEIVVKDGQLLTIKGRRKETQTEGVQWLRRERGFGAFERHLRLPELVDQDNVEASLKNGVLTIALPKSPSVLPRRIQVRAE
jgi:HSP20 family protein